MKLTCPPRRPFVASDVRCRGQVFRRPKHKESDSPPVRVRSAPLGTAGARRARTRPRRLLVDLRGQHREIHTFGQLAPCVTNLVHRRVALLFSEQTDLDDLYVLIPSTPTASYQCPRGISRYPEAPRSIVLVRPCRGHHTKPSARH